MLTPVYLRFDSEEQAAKYLPPMPELTQSAATMKDTMPDDPVSAAERMAVVQEWRASRRWLAAFDVVGTIYEPTGRQIKGAMGMHAEMAPAEGWHVNLLIAGELPEELAQFEVKPAAPSRKWAGY